MCNPQLLELQMHACFMISSGAPTSLRVNCISLNPTGREHKQDREPMQALGPAAPSKCSV